MNYPKIVFKYSWIYDQTWKEGLIGKKSKKYPSSKHVLNYIKKIEKLWQKEERRILLELSKISHLKWESKFIYCYVVGRCRPFSDPLTISVYEKYPDYFIDVLTHELIHNLFIQPGNYQKSKKAWGYFHQKYKKFSRNTRIHIPLQAIHSYIYYKFFNEKRLKRDIKLISFLPDYKKSWQIVQKEGYKNIINEFVKRVK
ncbi:MAG: hypothetical protein COW72_00100 [Candidatus Nealsonbacteria bacterium CG18_big_fil_WC_8_21_14_2_50_37_10]|uniref:Uncharacterized protein n=1 Tax=Candidatus Nealsonbacteria bacterium CG18_big_fil_WC_8_21_14_2_50_37_10 TaxID=1974717 RepID=A0A2H0FN92_9BACT|nr:MAG: hypothetical protein COW72_00100 [Candidatus Nealsonbacteria bacterium CG18_big_fil_WC_8_21_14_2_50_37_10]